MSGVRDGLGTVDIGIYIGRLTVGEPVFRQGS